MKPLIIIKTGSTFPTIRQRAGDFEDWIIHQIGSPNAEITVVNAMEGETAILIMENIFESKRYKLNFQVCLSFYRILFSIGVAKPYRTRGPILLPIRFFSYFAGIAVERTRIFKTTALSV